MSDVSSDTAQRKLTTILCADVSGYSRFMARDEELALRLLRAHREIFASVSALHGGRIFNTGGDSILCEFASPVEAVRAATEIQQSVDSRNAALPEDDRMRFRIGINLGDVLVHGDDLLGDGVNVAARIQTVAPVGGISLSSSVYDQISGKLNLGFQELGEKEFKNLGRPIRTFTVVQAGETALPRSVPTAPASAKPRWPWAVAAVLVLGLAGGGFYWWQGEREAARIEADRQKVEQARIKAEVERLAAEEARRKAVRDAAASRQTGAPPAAVAAVPKPPPEALAKFDGVFNGRMCVAGVQQQEAPRCTPAVRVSVRAGVVTGGWGGAGGNGRFHGSVDAEGRVNGQIDTQDHSSGRTNTAQLTGTISADQLNLAGAFDKGGRRITVEMRRGP